MLTVCIDEHGKQLATYPDLMKQVSLGAAFYVGQELHFVIALSMPSEEDDLMIVTLKKAEKR